MRQIMVFVGILYVGLLKKLILQHWAFFFVSFEFKKLQRWPEVLRAINIGLLMLLFLGLGMGCGRVCLCVCIRLW